MSQTMPSEGLPPFVLAGVCAGLAGLLTFLLIHHFWIQPIWFIAPVGVVIAGAGGVVVGWSYAEILVSLPPRPWTFLALTAVIAVILAPSIILAQLTPPLIDLATFSLPPQAGPRAALAFIFELIMTAVIIGGAAGWYLGHTRRAMVATAIAGLVYALGPGHNIPFLGHTPAVGKGLALLLAVTLVAAFVLVEANAALFKR